MNTPPPRPLTLIGMSGVGKSFWARLLHEQKGFGWHDCDAMIGHRLSEIVRPEPGEAPVLALGRWMGMPWTDGYAEREARYLALEAEVTQQAVHDALETRVHTSSVIDSTGSAIYLPRTLLSQLQRETFVVYLAISTASQQRLLERYLQEPKPIVWGQAFRPHAGETDTATLARCYPELLRYRDASYRALAHEILDADVLEHGPATAEFFMSCVHREAESG